MLFRSYLLNMLRFINNTLFKTVQKLKMINLRQGCSSVDTEDIVTHLKRLSDKPRCKILRDFNIAPVCADMRQNVTIRRHFHTYTVDNLEQTLQEYYSDIFMQFDSVIFYTSSVPVWVYVNRNNCNDDLTKQRFSEVLGQRVDPNERQRILDEAMSQLGRGLTNDDPSSVILGLRDTSLRIDIDVFSQTISAYLFFLQSMLILSAVLAFYIYGGFSTFRDYLRHSDTSLN